MVANFAAWNNLLRARVRARGGGGRAATLVDLRLPRYAPPARGDQAFPEGGCHGSEVWRARGGAARNVVRVARDRGPARADARSAGGAPGRAGPRRGGRAGV